MDRKSPYECRGPNIYKLVREMEQKRLKIWADKFRSKYDEKLENNRKPKN